MCDSFVALPSTTARQSMIFAKSADCQLNEAHYLVHLPHTRHVKGEAVRVTCVVIPQAEETYEVLLSKSFWTYGGEIGINEYGLSIGNEAVYTTLQNEEKVEGVVGTDLLRLALERARNAREAIEVISSLLKQFGQGGNCELPGNSHFDINYLLVDPKEAWVLETAGREWAARQVREIGSISNGFIIGKDWDQSSVGDQAHELDWNSTYGDQSWIPKLGVRERQSSSYNCLAAGKGHLTVQSFFAALRSHGDMKDPTEGNVIRTLCAHSGVPNIRAWQATGAMVTEVRGEEKIAWATGTSGTCLSIFKPIFLGVDLPDIGPMPTEHFNPATMWWQHELLHRRAMADFEQVQPEIQADFAAVEAEFLAEAEIATQGTSTQKKELMDYCFQKARYAEQKWIDRLAKRQDLKFARPEICEMWKTANSEAGITGMPA